MALVTDPDNLSQGTSSAETIAFTSSSGATTTMTGTGLPAIAAGEFFEIRDHSVPGNNGLYLESGGSPLTTSVTADKITGLNPTDSGSEAVTWLGDSNTEAKNVHFDTDGLEVYLLEQGALSTDGVIMIALHSFMKEEWKSDAFLVAAARFPMVGISFAAGQWVMGTDPSGNNSGWKFAEDDIGNGIQTRRLIRNAGWDELDDQGVTLKKYFNVTTLGDFEDSVNDQAYYFYGNDPTDTAAATDYEFAGPVNEPVKYYEEVGNPDTLTFVDGGGSDDTLTRATGSFITDGFTVGGQVTIRAANTAANNGTYTITSVAALTLGVATGSWTTGEADTSAQISVDNSNAFTTALRVRDGDTNGKTFSLATLSSGGETQITSKIIKLPLSNQTDLDISSTDATITTTSPWTEIRLRYLDAAYNREVDSTTKREYGIVVDVGTHSESNGASAGSTLFTSANLSLGTGEDLTDYTGGTLIIHEGTDQGSHTISGTPVNNAGTLEVTLSSALTGTESNLSFTIQRATPVSATKNEIYEKVQYLLRQAADIDSTDSIVTGKTADPLALFVGPDLRMGSQSPTNPNGGGSGVIIEGFDANDTNNLFFFDNTGTTRNFPFVAAGTLNFSQTLVDDTDGEYWLYYEYTTRTSPTDGAVVSPSGDSYDLESPGSSLPTLAVNDYIDVSGFAGSDNNGLFIVTAINTANQDYSVRRVDGKDVGTAESGVTINVDQNPYPSPDAIIVDDNSGADIVGPVNSTSVAFDYDYENNVQGGRTADTDANVVLVAAGHETAQVAVVAGLTITKTTGLSFSITSALERNYDNS